MRSGRYINACTDVTFLDRPLELCFVRLIQRSFLVQAFRQEAQQLQAQLQRAQQEEADQNAAAATSGNVELPAEQRPPLKSEQIKSRLTEVDRSIKQVSGR